MKYKVELEELDDLIDLSGKLAVLEYKLTKYKSGSVNWIKTLYERDNLKVLLQQRRGNIMMPSNFIK